jgi:hypothetical protein
MVHLTVPRDLGADPDSARPSGNVISAVAAGVFGALAVVISVILTDSLVINRVADSLLRWPLAITVGAVIALKYIAEGALVSSREESALKEERLYLARVVSPGMAMTISASLFAIIYIWTQSFIAAFIGAVVIATPYFLLFLVFPRLAVARLESSKRSLIIEAILIGAFTFGVYALIQLLPTTVIAKSQAFILLGLLPGLLHGVYSVFVASSEHVAGKAKEEAIA